MSGRATFFTYCFVEKQYVMAINQHLQIIEIILQRIQEVNYILLSYFLSRWTIDQAFSRPVAG